jgi:phage terminase large subunit
MTALRPPSELLTPKLRSLFFRAGPNGSAIWAPSRYKVAYGGRGSAKSWGFGGVGVSIGTLRPLRFLWVRETQSSIKESVHALLKSRIENLGLSRYYDVQEQAIYGYNGTEHVFAGIKTDPGKIKSAEGFDVCVVVEAEKVSETSWKVLAPTIRETGSEIWVEFNPRDIKDPTSQRFIERMPPQCRRVKVNWSDNPFFPAELELERQYALQLINEAKDDDERAQYQADYDHVWEGFYQQRSDAAVFRRRVVIEDFDGPPERTRLHFGADWGFANDPTALIRFWITNHKDERGLDYQELWIDHEKYGYRCEIDETPALFDQVPESRKWPIKADGARPETISYMRRHGFNITAAEKWQGSLEDGVAHVKGFRRIHIHTRCKKLQEEARLYQYKIDRTTNEVLPIILDANNHGWDAVRYGLDGYIQRRGGAGVWAKLAK